MKKTITLSLLAMTMSVFAGNDFISAKIKSEAPTNEKTSSVLVNPIPRGFTKRHVVKLNLTPLSLKNISLQYEFGFHKHFSAAVGASFLIPSTLPSQIFNTEDADADGGNISNPNFTGYTLTPEFRFYLGRKGAPRGFYIAPYYRYSSFKVSADGEMAATATEPEVKADVSAKFASSTGGLMIGCQWLLGKHFALDWWIVGGGYGNSKLTVVGEATSGVFSIKNQEDLEADIQDGLESVNQYLGGNVETNVSSEEVKAVVKGLKAISLRGFGLCLGIYF